MLLLFLLEDVSSPTARLYTDSSSVSSVVDLTGGFGLSGVDDLTGDLKGEWRVLVL